jgi:hypothetical protein
MIVVVIVVMIVIVMAMSFDKATGHDDEGQE